MKKDNLETLSFLSKELGKKKKVMTLGYQYAFRSGKERVCFLEMKSLEVKQESLNWVHLWGEEVLKNEK